MNSYSLFNSDVVKLVWKPMRDQEIVGERLVGGGQAQEKLFCYFVILGCFDW